MSWNDDDTRGRTTGAYSIGTQERRRRQVLPSAGGPGFWVGTSAADRVWVQLTGAAGESAYTVKPGDRISFTDGKVVLNGADIASQVGVNADEGAEQLTSQGQHITVSKSAVRLSS